MPPEHCQGGQRGGPAAVLQTPGPLDCPRCPCPLSPHRCHQPEWWREASQAAALGCLVPPSPGAHPVNISVCYASGPLARWAGTPALPHGPPEHYRPSGVSPQPTARKHLELCTLFLKLFLNAMFLPNNLSIYNTGFSGAFWFGMVFLLRLFFLSIFFFLFYLFIYFLQCLSLLKWTLLFAHLGKGQPVPSAF